MKYVPTYLEELDYSLLVILTRSLQQLADDRRAAGLPEYPIIRSAAAYTTQGGNYRDAIIIERREMAGEDWLFHAHSEYYDIAAQERQSTHRLRLTQVSYLLRFLASTNRGDAFLSNVARAAFQTNGLGGDFILPIFTLLDAGDPVQKDTKRAEITNTIAFTLEREYIERVVGLSISNVLLYDLATAPLPLIEQIEFNFNHL